MVRDDGFDCVTYCETVLAAAIARSPAAFAPALRAIRYHNGVVEWRERNHYFFDWSAHNVANGTCRVIAMKGEVELDKTVTWHKALGRRHFAMHVIPRASFLANRAKLATGDIVGFVTRRPNLDYFHVGFVAFGTKGEFLLRHASRMHGRVLDERMARFVAITMCAMSRCCGRWSARQPDTRQRAPFKAPTCVSSPPWCCGPLRWLSTPAKMVMA